MEISLMPFGELTADYEPNDKTTLDLPREIRDLIYKFRYGSPDLVMTWRDAKPIFKTIDCKLFSVSSHVKEEAEVALYANTRLRLYNDRRPDLARWPQKFLQHLQHTRFLDLPSTPTRLPQLQDGPYGAMPNLKSLLVRIEDSPVCSFESASEGRDGFIPYHKTEVAGF